MLITITKFAFNIFFNIGNFKIIYYTNTSNNNKIMTFI